MCNLNEKHKLLDIPIMLDGGALSYYASNIPNRAKNYENAVEMLKHWLILEGQRTRLLHEQGEIRLTSWFKGYPEKSQSTVFREMCDKLTSVQRHLYPDYRNQRYLCDQPTAAADTGSISPALKENIPTTGHDTMQKNCNTFIQ